MKHFCDHLCASHLAAFYLDGIVEGFSVIHDWWSHQTNDQGLEFATELRLQVIDQVLSQHGSPGEVNVTEHVVKLVK